MDEFDVPKIRWNLAHHVEVVLGLYVRANEMKKLGVPEDSGNLFSSHYILSLHRVHDVAITAIKGYVVPTPISDGADPVAPTH